MEKIELTYKQLYELYGNDEHEVPCRVTDELYVKTPTGFTKINDVVTKHNNEVIRLDFNDGDTFECSINHILCDYDTGTPIAAIDAQDVTSIYGKKTITEKTPIGNENVYDISIDSPHWYLTNVESGLYHHNTFFALAVVKNFLDTNPGAMCLYFDTESAVSRKLLEERGVDTSRIVVINLVTVEEFRNKALNAVELYMKKPEAERSPCLFVLDSLGMLSTTKEIEDTLNDKQVRDMTRAQLLKGTFRVLTLKLGLAKIPMIVTNHLYDVTGAYVPTKEQGGGSGLKFAATTIIYLSKKKEKDGTEVVGNIIKAKAVKSRLSRENRDVEVRLFYDERGLDRYYGLLPLAVEGGIIERVGNRYAFGEKKFWEKEILKNPETFFTQDVLEQIDVYAQKKFKYGSSLTVENKEEETED
jgi:RecA/RadA recombinase